MKDKDLRQGPLTVVWGAWQSLFGVCGKGVIGGKDKDKNKDKDKEQIQNKDKDC